MSHSGYYLNMARQAIHAACTEMDIEADSLIIVTHPDAFLRVVGGKATASVRRLVRRGVPYHDSISKIVRVPIALLPLPPHMQHQSLVIGRNKLKDEEYGYFLFHLLARWNLCEPWGQVSLAKWDREGTGLIPSC